MNLPKELPCGTPVTEKLLLMPSSPSTFGEFGVDITSTPLNKIATKKKA